MPSEELLPYQFASYVFFLFLLFQKLTLTAYVTSITFSRHILTNCLDGFTRNDFCTDSRLNRNLKLLTRYQFLQFFAHPTS